MYSRRALEASDIGPHHREEIPLCRRLSRWVEHQHCDTALEKAGFGRFEGSGLPQHPFRGVLPEHCIDTFPILVVQVLVGLEMQALDREAVCVGEVDQ